MDASDREPSWSGPTCTVTKAIDIASVVPNAATRRVPGDRSPLQAPSVRERRRFHQVLAQFPMTNPRDRGGGPRHDAASPVSKTTAWAVAIPLHLAWRRTYRARGWQADDAHGDFRQRKTEGRGVGKESGSMVRSRWWRYPGKKNKTHSIRK